MDRTLIECLDARRYDACIAFITVEDDPARVLAMFHGGIRHAYWSNKDIDGVVALGRAARALAEPIEDPKLLGLLKSIAFDVGSFCWPGWREPGIEITPPTLEIGAEAAALNLELARRLERPDAPMANAHWLVGAHHLASGRSDEASASFEESARHARLADDRATELLAIGYVAIARGERPDVAEIRTTEHGEDLAAQLTTAADEFLV
jgi:hypothetical protein